MDSLYEFYFHSIFYGCLEIIQLKIQPIRSASSIKAINEITIPRAQQNGKIIYLLSRVAREINLQNIFEELCKQLELRHATSSDQWQTFVVERIPVVKDSYDLYSIQLRKMFIDYYHDSINSMLVQYVDDLKQKSKSIFSQGSSDEPANISSVMLKIALLVHKDLLVDLNLNFRNHKFS